MIDENSTERKNWIVRTFTRKGKSLFYFEIKDRTYQEAVKEAESDIEESSAVFDWTISEMAD